MNKVFILFIFFLTTWTSSCIEKPPNQDTTGTLEIIFKARYDETPLVLYQNIATNQTDPTSILFKKLDFFISDIKGLTDGGSSVDFSDVGYISMQQNLDQASAEAGTSFRIDGLSLGDYTQLDLGVGLSDAVNSTTPGDYSSSSPLGLNSNYWASWNSYILCKLEGDITQANSTSSSFLLHSGVNGMYQPRSFTTNFSIAAGQTTPLIIYLDAEDLFFKTGSEIDLINDNVTHSGAVGSTEYNLAKTTLENIANSLTL